MIYPDQSCTIPGCSIHRIIHMVQDMIHYSQRAGLLSANVSLDQEKDVAYEYLLGTLCAFGFGTCFVARIQLLYDAMECLMKDPDGAPTFWERSESQLPLFGQCYSHMHGAGWPADDGERLIEFFCDKRQHGVTAVVLTPMLEEG
eukprot:g41958.t1